MAATTTTITGVETTVAAAVVGKPQWNDLTKTSQLIISEAERRGVSVRLRRARRGWFSLSYNGRTISCRSSLTELTPAASVRMCLDKKRTNKVLKNASLRVPEQIVAGDTETNAAFFLRHKRVVTKPLNLNSGEGISVDIRHLGIMEDAITALRKITTDHILIEEFVEGYHVRVLVIDYMFAAAVHHDPPSVTGDGTQTIGELIVERNNGDFNTIPFDDETTRITHAAGYQLTDVLPKGSMVVVRKNTNEHTGAISRDVTERISPMLRNLGEEIARLLNAPVVGIDLLVTDIDGDDYVVIEVNGRPGFSGHEPQPIAEMFMNFLFPETLSKPSAITT